MTRRKLSWILGLGVLLAILASLLAGWAVALGSGTIPEDRVSSFLPWPVACTPRGCVTTRMWREQMRLSAIFAEGAKTKTQTHDEALTTVVRRQLVSQAFVVNPVTAADARRYREEILHLKDEEKLREMARIGFAEYDKLVVIPFLQQAALLQERNTETVDELYKGLAQERLVLVLPFHYRWDKDTGRVVAR